jgi:hypothetical protein
MRSTLGLDTSVKRVSIMGKKPLMYEERCMGAEYHLLDSRPWPRLT